MEIEIIKIKKWTFIDLFENKFDYILNYFNKFSTHLVKLRNKEWIEFSKLNIKINDVDDIYEIDFDNNTFALWYGTTSVYTTNGMTPIKNLKIGDRISNHKIGTIVWVRPL